MAERSLKTQESVLAQPKSEYAMNPAQSADKVSNTATGAKLQKVFAL